MWRSIERITYFEGRVKNTWYLEGRMPEDRGVQTPSKSGGKSISLSYAKKLGNYRELYEELIQPGRHIFKEKQLSVLYSKIFFTFNAIYLAYV